MRPVGTGYCKKQLLALYLTMGPHPASVLTLKGVISGDDNTSCEDRPGGSTHFSLM